VAAAPTTIIPFTIAPLAVVHFGGAQSMFKYIQVLLWMPDDKVSIAMIFTAADKGYGAGEVVKLVLKKTKTIKSEHVALDTITHMEFIKELFCVHDLADQYSPGIHIGLRFKFSWTGSPYVALSLL
jgi:hypothetical protein